MGVLENIPWDKIFDMILKLLESCKANSEDSVVNEIRNPGLVSRWRFRRALAKAGVTLTAEELDEVYRRGATASQLELQQLVREGWGAF